MPERRLELPLKGLAESRRTLNPGSVGVVCATSIDAAMPLLIRREEPSEARRRAAVVLSELGLGDRLEHLPAQLSGGERQRVAIARALVTSPRCVLADEPTGNLDQETAAAVFELFLKAAREEHAALLIVTHDRELARRCDRVLELKQGVIRDAS